MITLGIETSCDETALALIETRQNNGAFECRVIASLVHSQAELHSAYGGVYPSLAKREHGKNLVPLLHKLLIESQGAVTVKKSRVSLAEALAPMKHELETNNSDLYESVIHAPFLADVPSIDRIAVTEGPGLEPTLWVGINFARILGRLWGVPVMPVNHMEGHVVGSLLQSDAARGDWQKLKPLEFPALALLISGGHTELVRVDTGFRYDIMGATKDDAVGEAFDKTARLLGLPYPGGPHISMLAHQARERDIAAPVSLPRPMMKSGDLDFSFSGLKTAVLYAVRAHATNGVVTDEFKKGLAREFEDAVVETITAKTRAALEKIDARTLIVGGGVSANRLIRTACEDLATEFGIPAYMPSPHVSGDNALMIALAGAMNTATHSRPLKAHGTKRLGHI